MTMYPDVNTWAADEEAERLGELDDYETGMEEYEEAYRLNMLEVFLTETPRGETILPDLVIKLMEVDVVSKRRILTVLLSDRDIVEDIREESEYWEHVQYQYDEYLNHVNEP